MSATRRRQQPRPQAQQADTVAEGPTAPAPAPADRPAVADECRVPDCTKPTLQNGVCYRHFLEGRRA